MSSVTPNHKDLSPDQTQALLKILKTRFESNMIRHPNLKWSEVQSKLEINHDKLWSLSEMERTGGEPDVVDFDQKTGEYIFFDCSPETPKCRISICYDQQAWNSRKVNKPDTNAEAMSKAMGTELLNEEQYRYLQSLGRFDLKTSSWIATPALIRSLGGGLFAHYRYGQVFVYHNGVESYYATRGFRGCLRV